jgi:hypothetical protein
LLVEFASIPILAIQFLRERILFSKTSRLSTFEAVDALSREYSSSIPATTIRLVQYGPEPAMLVCHGPAGRKWFNRPQQIPERWFPRDDLSTDSSAMNVLFGKNRSGRRNTVGAQAWFDRWDASRYELYEQSFKISDQEVLTGARFTGAAIGHLLVLEAQRICLVQRLAIGGATKCNTRGGSGPR